MLPLLCWTCRVGEVAQSHERGSLLWACLPLSNNVTDRVQAHSVQELHANAAAKQRLQQARQAAQERQQQDCCFKPLTNTASSFSVDDIPCRTSILRASTQVGILHQPSALLQTLHTIALHLGPCAVVAIPNNMISGLHLAVPGAVWRVALHPSAPCCLCACG
jgi:hypothetical protein